MQEHLGQEPCKQEPCKQEPWRQEHCSLRRCKQDPWRQVTIETLVLPYAEGRKRAWLFEQDVVQSEVQGEEGVTVTVRWSAIQKARYDAL